VHAVDSNPEVARTAVADQMVALGLLVAVDALLRWRDGGGAAWLRLGALALAFLAAAKGEGKLYVLAFAVAGALGGLAAGPPRAALRRAAWLGLPLAAAGAGWLVNARFGFQNDLAQGAALDILRTRGPERLGPLLANFGRLYFQVPKENGLLYAAFLGLCVLAPWRLLRPNARFVSLLVLALLLGWSVIYLCTPYDLDWHMLSSAPRLTYQALPVVALCLALVLADDPVLARWLSARAPLEPPEAAHAIRTMP
jgi:hypothetical protein